MSIFTSQVTESVAVADGHAVVVRKLAPKHLRKAQKAQQFEAMDDLRHMGGPKFLKEIQDALAADTTLAKKASNPLHRYHRDELLACGVVSWSMDAKVTPAAIEDLDEDTQDVLADRILRLSVPSLYLTAEESETAIKND